MKQMSRENREKKETNRQKRFPKSRPQTSIQHPMMDKHMIHNLRKLSSYKSRKNSVPTIPQQFKRILSKLCLYVLSYFDYLLYFLLRPVPVPQLPPSSSSTSLLTSSTSSTLSQSSVRRQQQRLLQGGSGIKTKRNTSSNHATHIKKWHFKSKTKSSASLTRHANTGERIIYVPIMNSNFSRTARPTNCSLEQFAVDCFTRK